MRDYKKELEEKEAKESARVAGEIMAGLLIAMFLWWLLFGY